MAGNNRVYYAIQEMHIGAYCSNSGTAVHGIQTVGLNSSFNLDRILELGQLDIYALIETVPNIEITVEKVIDGYPLIYHLATQGATQNNLLNRTNQRADVFFSVFSDAQVSASGSPLTQVYCSGMYVNSLNYRFPLQGNLTESVTLVGNDKVWSTSAFRLGGNFNNTDSPASGVKRRWNVNMGSGQSVFPLAIPGITSVAGSGFNMLTNGVYGAHIQDINITVNLGREDLFELGRRRPYYRFANFPVSVNCSIAMTPGGTTPGDLINMSADTDSTTNEPIMIVLDEGSQFDLGTKNRISSVTYTGGDVGGGVVTQTYNYENFNVLRVYSPYDPVALP